jgi:hypothetical protein
MLADGERGDAGAASTGSQVHGSCSSSLASGAHPSPSPRRVADEILADAKRVEGYHIYTIL